MQRPIFLLLVSLLVPSAWAQLLPNNFWPNSQFEQGVNLDDPVSGVLSNWNRGGSEPGICQISGKALSPAHALAVVDQSNGFGEWYSDLSLAGRAAPGDKLDLRWHEIYNIEGSEMRVTLVFFNSGGGLTGVKHFTVRGASEGFGTSLDDSTFTERNETAEIPEDTAVLRVSLVSGGTLETRGIYVIDDLSVARQPAPILLPGNVWTNNPTFELGDNLDATNGTLTAWNRGGSKPAICQITTNAFISPTHALAVVDSDNSYGEWYSDLPLAGVARTGDLLDLQWFETYNISSGEMRLTVLFLGEAGGVVDVKHFVVRGRSAGWLAKTFTRRNETLTVPEGAATLRISLVSGGAPETRGTMYLDDVSVKKSPPPLPPILPGNLWPNPTLEQGANLNDPALGQPEGWNRGGNDPSISIVTRSNSVSSSHSLAVVDANPDGFGEWFANFPLNSVTAPGKLLNIQWFELFNITDGEMRLSLLFFDTNSQVAGQYHFVAHNQSEGWKGSVAASTFTRRNEQVAVPVGAVRLQVLLSSGGPASSQGTMVIDNFSLAPEPSLPVVLFGNFWPNPGFEEGTNLTNSVLGTPTGWLRAGMDPTIPRVEVEGHTSASHSLTLVDTNISASGEWSSTLDLAGAAAAGDMIEVQWWQMHSVDANGVMSLVISFLDAANNTLAQTNLQISGQNSGWRTNLADSFFTRQQIQLLLPSGVARMRTSLQSGAPATTGLLLIDDFSVAKPLPPPEILAGNFWPNPTFEEGTQLDNPTAGQPAAWNRGGTYIRGDRVSHDKATSPTHALELFDDKTDAYSEWYRFWPFNDLVHGGDTLEVQWFWVYDTQGDMRLSFVFYGADDSVVGQTHFIINGQSDDWRGDLATSPFVRRREQFQVPAAAVRALTTVASGGSLTVTGRLLLDDLSMRVLRDEPAIAGLASEMGGWRLTWQGKEGQTFAVESTDSLSPANFQPVPGGETLAAGPAGLTSFLDSRPAAAMRLYRVRVIQ